MAGYTGKYYEGVGRRKTSTARVRIYAGQGNFRSMTARWKNTFPARFGCR